MKISLGGSHGNLFYAAFAANLASAAVGTHYSWSSPTIPKLQEAGSWLPINNEQVSWIGSLTPLGTAFGPFVGGWLVNRIGRRFTIMTSVMVGIIGWIVLLLANSIEQIYIGKLIGGLAGGTIFLACPLYIAEISEPELRGALGSLFAFFLVGGYLIEYCFGPFVSYSTLIYINFIPAIVFFLMFSIAPESPYYFLQKNKSTEALESLTWLRQTRSSDEVQKELDDMQVEITQSMSQKVKFTDLFRNRGNRMGLLLSWSLLAGQQLSGVNVVLAYAQNIFIMAGSSFSSSISTIIVGTMLFCAGGLAPPLAKAFGMKKMFIVSAIGMSVFQFILGFFFYFKTTDVDMSAFSWLPVTSLVGFIFTYTIGFGPLPWAVMAEVFPPNIKALASAVTASFCWILAFMLTRFFNDISALLGTYTAFFSFAACCIVSLLFTIFVLPDTQGMTLQEILDLLNNQQTVNVVESQEQKYQHQEQTDISHHL